MYKYKATAIITEQLRKEKLDYNVILIKGTNIEVIETKIRIELLPVELRYIVFDNDNISIETGDIIMGIPDDRIHIALKACNMINRKRKVAYCFYVTTWGTIRMRHRFLEGSGNGIEDVVIESYLCNKVEMEAYYSELCKAIFTEEPVDSLFENTSDSLIKAMCTLLAPIAEKM